MTHLQIEGVRNRFVYLARKSILYEMHFFWALLLLFLCGYTHVEGAVANIPLQFNENGKLIIREEFPSLGDNFREVSLGFRTKSYLNLSTDYGLDILIVLRGTCFR